MKVLFIVIYTRNLPVYNFKELVLILMIKYDLNI